jgi:hypothetical protein
MKQYVQTDLEAHRQVATTLADLILGGVLLSGVTEAETNAGALMSVAPRAKLPCTNPWTCRA